MKRLIVCGDSFMSPRITVPNTHFTEIFTQKLNFDTTWYSRSGISNGGIILQLEEAMKEKPDLIFFNITNSDRIEFPRNDHFDLANRPVELKSLSYENWQTDLSCVTNKFNGNLISDNLGSIVNDLHGYQERSNIDDKKIEALDLWIRELYINSWKHKIDYLMLYAITHKLHVSGIPYLLFHDYIGVQDFVWLTDITYIHKTIHVFRNTHKPTDYDPGYHTSFKTQEDIAEFVIEHYNKYFNHDAD